MYSVKFFSDLAFIQYYSCARKTLKILFLFQAVKLRMYKKQKKKIENNNTRPMVRYLKKGQSPTGSTLFFVGHINAC